MGITTDSLNRLERVGALASGTKMLVCGCQNIYDTSFEGVTYGMKCQDYFESIGVNADIIDLTGCNGADVVDLRKPKILEKYTKEQKYDVIVNHGTFEHIEGKEGFYNAFKNIHEAIRPHGLMIHETPKTGHWPTHGEHYTTEEFYEKLAFRMGYDIIELVEHFAMGNVKDGGLINCVLKAGKNTGAGFISLEKFLELDFREL